ncbi:MAG: glycoside hydrolase [Candidatus Mariimomonas ferrooxydans]
MEYQGRLIAQELYKGGYYHSPVSISVNNKIATLYLTEQGRVAFKIGVDVLFFDEDIDVKEQGHGRRPSLYQEGSHLYAIWWAKTRPKGDKHLYFKASYDGGETFQPTRIINSENGVLNYSFTSDSKGRLAFVYNDERNGPYQIYINISNDHGKTWLDKDVRQDSIPESVGERKARIHDGFAMEPKVAMNGQAIVVTWKERKAKKGKKAAYYLKSRASDDGGKTWGKEIVIRKSSRIFTSNNLLLHNDNFYIIGHENYTGITGYKSNDNGRTWEALRALQRSEETVNSQLKVISKGEYLYVVYTAQKPRIKYKIFFAAFSVLEGKWNGPVRLDRKRYDLTKSMNPDIALLKDGTIVTIWQDYRNIRTNIYINFSSDNGKTWEDLPVSIEESGRYLSVDPKLYVEGDNLFVFFQRYRDDTKDKLDYLYRKIKDIKKAGMDYSKDITEAEREEKLRERVNTFWTLRKNGQYADTYKYHDPVYKVKISKDNFVRYQGNVIYHRFKMIDLDIKENFANVKIELNFEVRETEIMGRKFSMPPRDSTLTEEWVWIYDNWYKVYKKTIGGKSYLKY